MARSNSYTYCRSFSEQLFVHLCSSWQYFNCHSALHDPPITEFLEFNSWLVFGLLRSCGGSDWVGLGIHIGGDLNVVLHWLTRSVLRRPGIPRVWRVSSENADTFVCSGAHQVAPPPCDVGWVFCMTPAYVSVRQRSNLALSFPVLLSSLLKMIAIAALYRGSATDRYVCAYKCHACFQTSEIPCKNLRITEVILRRARLLLGWVTVFARANNSVCNQPTQANSASYAQRDGKWEPAKVR